jgi:monoamine oxidase
VLTRYGPALREPFEGIHFAGTESSDYWIGYMDGAVRSGERVAKEVIEAFGTSHNWEIDESTDLEP